MIQRHGCRMVMLLVSTLTLLFGASCSVSKDPGTPAGFDCKPDAAGIAAFLTVLSSGTGLNSTAPGSTKTCLTCHGNSPGGDYSRKSRFRLQTQTVGTDLTAQAEDLCVVYLFGQLSQDQMIINYPQNPKHAGGAYTPTQLLDLISFVTNYRLPNDTTRP